MYNFRKNSLLSQNMKESKESENIIIKHNIFLYIGNKMH